MDLQAARGDRDVLEAWLRERGLADRARVIAREVATRGFRLVPAPEGEPCESRIGGSGLLPPGESWPHSGDGRPLSFLAGIDLAELPPSDLLPDSGWLLFFADLDDDEERGEPFYGEPTPNAPGTQARMLWLAPGARPVDADPPSDLSRSEYVRLTERRIAAWPQLTLPDGYESAERLGLGAAEVDAYDEIATSLRSGSEAGDRDDRYEDDDRREDDEDDADDLEDEPRDDGEPDDWVLGAVTGAQGHEPEADSVLLLHLGSIGWQDGGAIQFRIPRAALAERDWTRAWAEGDSM